MSNPPSPQSEFHESRTALTFTYLQIVYSQFMKWLYWSNVGVQDRPKTFPRKATWDFEIIGQKREAHIVAIVTSALFLESFIYDYVSRRKSEKTAQILDKLSPPNKWLIGTELICSPGIKIDSNEYKDLTLLFKHRNNLVHHKSQKEGNVFSMPDLPQELLPEDCFDIVGKTLKKLTLLDEEEEIARLFLRQIAAWISVSSQEVEFYPVWSNA